MDGPAGGGSVAWQHIDRRKYIAYGSAFNMAAASTLYPLRVAKTRLQLHHRSSKLSTNAAPSASVHLLSTDSFCCIQIIYLFFGGRDLRLRK